jgi:predicted metal-dependent phosphoesterase TrpH
MLKVELHAHTADDPSDRIPHTAEQLIDHAATLGYGALAITLHDRQLDITRHASYARERGITLIPGVERTFGRVHVLLLNFPREAARLRSYDELARLKRRCNGLVIVPHPFYPIRSAMGRQMDGQLDLIDAVEWNAMYTRELNFNRRASEWAAAHSKPLVGNTDLHRLAQMGFTWSTVDVDPGASADAICEAIRDGRVELHTSPLSWPTAASLFGRIALGSIRWTAWARRRFGGRTSAH